MMKKYILILTALLLFTFPGCTSTGPNLNTNAPLEPPPSYLVPETITSGEPEVPESVSPADDPLSQEKLEQYYEESRKHGFPFTIVEFTEDLDGDGGLDTVRLLEEWYPFFNEQNEPSYDRGIWHYPVIEFIVGDKTFSYQWEDISYESTLSKIEDSSGADVFIASFDTGGTGFSNYSLYALSYNDGLKFLPAPTFQTVYGQSFGFAASALYTDHYCICVSVPETGFSDTIYLPDLMTNDSLYDESGNCINTECTVDVQNLCSVSTVDYQGKNAIKLVQPIGNGSAMQNLGYLISLITWKNQECIVLNQSVEIRQ